MRSVTGSGLSGEARRARVDDGVDREDAAMAERSIDIYGAGKPAEPGMSASDICTPALVVDLDAFDRNLERLKRFAEAQGIALRPHAKTHKSADIALAQIERAAPAESVARSSARRRRWRRAASATS